MLYPHLLKRLITSILIISVLPNFVVEWVPLLLRIREVPSSNLGPENGYPDSGFSWFSSVPPDECLDITLKLGYDRFLPNPFQVIIHLVTHSFDAIKWVTEKASLNKLQTNTFVWDFKFSRRRVWCSELSSGIYCRVKLLSSLIPDDGGSTHLWNVGRQ
jgi:hypothetical protein